MILLPVMVFFVSHSFFPNKQERFIFPVIPIILLLGVIGWEEFAKSSPFWLRHKFALKSLWIWIWVINFILLISFSTYYSKKSRVEAMYSLYGKQINGLLLVGGTLGTTQPPMFYTGTYPVPIYLVNNNEQLTQIKTALKTTHNLPNYAVFFGTEDINSRVQQIESSLRLKLTLEKRIEASFLDDVFYRLNPRNNKNQTAFVFNIDAR